MKGFNILLLFLLCTPVFGQQEKQIRSANTTQVQTEYSVYGKELDPERRLPASKVAAFYTELAATDTIPATFGGEVTSVCQAKGCWMKVALEDGQEVMVTFKDYAFFMPQDIAGKRVVLNGNAFIEETTVANQQHFARDSGMEEGAITAIKKPKMSYRFEAEGVLLQN